MNRLLIQFLIIAAMCSLSLHQAQAQHVNHKSHTRSSAANDRRTADELLRAGNKIYEAADTADNAKIMIAGYKKALRLYQKIIKQPNSTRYYRAPAYYNAGLCLRNLGHYEEALQEFRQALRFDSAASDYFGVAFCYLKLGDKEHADRALTEEESTSTNKAEKWADFGDRLYRDQRDVDTPNILLLEVALKAYEKSIQLDSGPKYYAISAYFISADIYCKLGQKAKADEAFKKPLTLELKGNDKELNSAYSLMTVEYIAHKMPVEGEIACKRAIRYNPDDTASHFNLAGLYYNAKRFSQAIEEYKLSYQIKPDYDTGWFLGLSYVSVGKNEKAVQVYEKVSARFPNHYDIYFSLGDAYDALDRKQEATAARKRPLRLKLQSDYDYDRLYDKYVELGWNNEALEACRKGLLAFPKSTSLHYHLGLAYLKAGNRQLALKQYSLLKTLDAKYAKLLFDAIYP